jgi:hypothetical protein
MFADVEVSRRDDVLEMTAPASKVVLAANGILQRPSLSGSVTAKPLLDFRP